MLEPCITVTWHAAPRILATRVSGPLRAGDVSAWRAELQDAVRPLSPYAPFKMLIDLRGYEVADQDLAVHRAMREVAPLFLAAHGFRVGFFRLYDETPPVSRGAYDALCTAVAHVHHDAAKMERYNELLETPHERFFTSADEAEAWLRAPERHVPVLP